MINEIKKNRHYATPFPWPKFYKAKEHYTYSLDVTFGESTKYDIGEDQSDVNKLFGISYGFHQKNSDRFGWRYNPERDMIEIVAYSYNNGKRIATKSIMFVELDYDIHLELDVTFKDNVRTVKFKCPGNTLTVNYQMDKVPCFGYTLGIYFGGNKKAPHLMKIYTYNKKLNY